MSGFFQGIDEKFPKKQWGQVFDWLFDDSKFNKNCGWDKTGHTNFTEAMKKLDSFPNTSFVYKKSSTEAPSIPSSTHCPDKATVIIGDKIHIGEKVVRHIRNGVAHGNATIDERDSIFYVKISDVKNKINTAFIYIPLSCICDICALYREIEQSFTDNEVDKNA